MIRHNRLLRLLSYSYSTGTFTRRASGRVAGSKKTGGSIVLMVDGRRYLANRLAWFYAYGEWPTGNVRHRDGDVENNAIDNLWEEIK